MARECELPVGRPVARFALLLLAAERAACIAFSRSPTFGNCPVCEALEKSCESVFSCVARDVLPLVCAVEAAADKFVEICCETFAY